MTLPRQDGSNARAFPNLTESRKRSKSLFGRIFLTRTGVHFARKCSKWDDRRAVTAWLRTPVFLWIFLVVLPFADIGRAQTDGVPLAAPTIAVDSEVVFNTRTTHALSLFGTAKYPEDFQHFDYVNPDAPKGGRVRLIGMGSFDSLHPFVTQGNSALGLGRIYDTLISRSLDEPATQYGLLAESIEIPDDYSWVTYTLREGARWHDGTPVTPEDVIFSLNILKDKGQPFYRFYYQNVVEARKVGERSVKFIFGEAGNRELPLITGELVIFPKHYWEATDEDGNPRDFSKSTLEPPLGSGPYRVGKFEPGRFIEFERVEDYWGAALPINIGQHNFDYIRYEYYRDSEVSLTALFADEYDIRVENSAKMWATRYDAPPVKDGRIKKELIADQNPAPMQGWFINTRRDKFKDRRVREALSLAFNFEWANKQLFYGQYVRLNSYFDNSKLASHGLPTAQELALLEPYRDQLPEEVFTKEFRAPQTDGSGTYRANLAKAIELLGQAGWSIRDGLMTNDETGQPLTIEFLLVQPSFERVVQPYLRDLEKIGIEGSIRLVDVAQYENRYESADFDLIVFSAPQSLSPGNEQREYWGSEAADRQGSRNVAGVKDPVVDGLIEKIIFAADREALTTAVHALDRVLLWGHYVVPQWYASGDRYAYWDRFGRPENVPPYDPGIPDIWWYVGEASASGNEAEEAELGGGQSHGVMAADGDAAGNDGL